MATWDPKRSRLAEEVMNYQCSAAVLLEEARHDSERSCNRAARQKMTRARLLVLQANGTLNRLMWPGDTLGDLRPAA